MKIETIYRKDGIVYTITEGDYRYAQEHGVKL